MDAAGLHFVVGKGGVGKSAVAAALALTAADAGAKVLAVELGGSEGLARILGVSPRRHWDRVEAAPNLWVSWLEGGAALAEYLGLNLRAPRLLRRVEDSRPFRTFVAAAPGLKELMVVGKLRHEWRRGRETEGPGWDVIVVDAGASARALQYLEMPFAAARTFDAGVVHHDAERICALLRAPDVTRVHVVALPEELPLTEAAEMVARLRGDLGLPLGEVLVNRCRAQAPAGAEAAVARLEALSVGPALSAMAVAGRGELGWLRVQAEGISAFQARTGLPVRRLPRLEGGVRDPAAARRLGEALG